MRDIKRSRRNSHNQDDHEEEADKRICFVLLCSQLKHLNFISSFAVHVSSSRWPVELFQFQFHSRNVNLNCQRRLLAKLLAELSLAKSFLRQS